MSKIASIVAIATDDDDVESGKVVNTRLKPQLHNHDNYVDIFLRLRHRKLSVQFTSDEVRVFKDQDGSILQICLVTTLGAIYYFTRFSVDKFWLLNPLFLIGFIFGTIGAICWYIAVSYKIIMFAKSLNYRIPNFINYFTGFIEKSLLYNYIIDLLPIILALTTGLYLLARVLQGNCDFPDDSKATAILWKQQYCNSESLSHSLPFDQYGFHLLIILCVQTTFKGSNKISLTIAWSISIIFMNVSLFYASSLNYAWANMHFITTMIISYEIEKLSKICWSGFFSLLFQLTKLLARIFSNNSVGGYKDPERDR